ncbi:hypothetical protein V2W45_1226558, partial [Cenococcum geophilum]
APEEEEGLNNKYFKFFTRFTKVEVKELTRQINLPTKFAINLRFGWLNALTSLPKELLFVFLWRSAHPILFRYIIIFFRISQPWLLRV